MKFFSLTIWTDPCNQSESAGIPPAARTIVTARAFQKLAPATPAKIIVAFADIFVAVDADRRPEKLVQTLQTKTYSSFYDSK